MRRVSSQDVPACVVVKKGDASDAGEILQVREDKSRRDDDDEAESEKGRESRIIHVMDEVKRIQVHVPRCWKAVKISTLANDETAAMVARHI